MFLHVPGPFWNFSIFQNRNDKILSLLLKEDRQSYTTSMRLWTPVHGVKALRTWVSEFLTSDPESFRAARHGLRKREQDLTVPGASDLAPGSN